jgi:copper transport protein
MRFLRRAKLAAIVSLAAAILFSPPSLFAHAKLLRSEPARGDTLTTLPHGLRLVFSEAPEVVLSRIHIVTSSGDTIPVANLRADPADSHALIADFPADVPNGAQKIVWKVAASDGHATSGEIGFTVSIATIQAAPAPTEPSQPDAATDESHDDTSMAVGGAIAGIAGRWLEFISLFLLAGVVTFRLVVLRDSSGKPDMFREIASVNAATLGLIASAGVILAAALKLGRESSDMPDVSMSAMMLGSLFGFSLLVQLVVPVVALIAFWSAHRDGNSANRQAWTAALVAVLAIIIAISLGSHASSSDRAWLAVPVDVIHIAAGSIWLGTLAVIVLVGFPAALKTPDTSVPMTARVAAMINSFSPMALTCGGVIVATGVTASFMRLHVLSDLWTTTYGSWLFRKLVFVLVLFVVAAWNWKRIRPRLVQETAVASLGRSATVELTLGILVLGITAILVALELP